MVFRELIEDHRGVAFAEALLAFPVLTIILAGVLAINAMYSAKLQAKANARLDGWRRSWSGQCSSSTCGSDCGGAESDVRTEGSRALMAARAGGVSLDETADRSFGGLAGRSAIGRAAVSARMPGILGEAKTTQRGRVELLCNTAPTRLPGETDVDTACRSDLTGLDYVDEACR